MAAFPRTIAPPPQPPTAALAARPLTMAGASGPARDLARHELSAEVRDGGGDTSIKVSVSGESRERCGRSAETAGSGPALGGARSLEAAVKAMPSIQPGILDSFVRDRFSGGT